jgi:HD-like signal output (HDOD) protein
MGSTRTAVRLQVQPAIASKVIELLVRRDRNALTDLVESDPSLCAVVVRAANAAHLGLSRRVQGVRQAMVLLGDDATTALAVARTADLVFESDTSLPLSPNWYWPHAVATATAAGSIARIVGANHEQAYTAGLVADLTVVSDAPHDADCAERGADMLAGWNFPEPIVQAVRNHHRGLDEVVATLDRVILAARAIAADAGFADGRPVPPVRDVQRVLDLGRSQVRSVSDDVERAIARLIRLAGR